MPPADDAKKNTDADQLADKGNGKTPSKAEAIKRLPKGTQVTVPVIDKKTGEPKVNDEGKAKSRGYVVETVDIKPEHILAVKDWGVVTVDGRKVPWRASEAA